MRFDRPLNPFVLHRRCSNVENLAPLYSKKADYLASGREASRRRRARVASGSMPQKVVKTLLDTQKHALKKQGTRKALKPLPLDPLPVPDFEAFKPVPPVEETVKAAPEAAVLPQAEKKQENVSDNLMHLPRHLHRPPPQLWPIPIRMENIEACDPALAGISLPFIRRGLEVTGEMYVFDLSARFGRCFNRLDIRMWNMAKNATVDKVSMGQRTRLPSEIDVLISDHIRWQTPALPQAPPTHVLALWDLPFSHQVHKNQGINPQTGRQKVSLVPVHDIFLAAYCGKWTPLGTPKEIPEQRVELNKMGAQGTKLTLPVVPLAVPHPASFLHLLQTLYTHKVSWLLDQLVPVPKPTMVLPTPENPNPQNPHYIHETGRRVAARFTSDAILEMIGMVIGLWQNAIYLGVSDTRLWIGIEWSYDMLLSGLAISLNRPELINRPYTAPQMAQA